VPKIITVTVSGNLTKVWQKNFAPIPCYTPVLLPPRRELSYNIRQRHHDRQLDIISGQLRSQ